jgi:glycosyltransferase involved in cell wall biosynthesis
MMEYMAAGKPIVAFDLAEHRYTAEDAARYACSNDVFDYARQILLLIENPQQCAEMGRLGQQRLVTELLWHFQAQALLSVYHRLSTQTLHRLIRA